MTPQATKHYSVVTLFPEMFDAIADCGITRRGLDEKAWQLKCWNPRDFATNAYKTIDDRPYGGGPGMVMLADPLEIDLAGFDGVVVSPGVPINRHSIADKAHAANVPLVGDIELF